MAGTYGSASDDLITQLREQPERFGLFAALRLIESHHPRCPRLGTSVKLSDDPVRLGQPPALDFAPATLAYCQQGDTGLPCYGNQPQAAREENPALQTQLRTLPMRLGVYSFGLFGPNGPLPLHLTEYARDRMRERDHTFARFADIFHHRMACLFYRAWANSQPTVALDRPEDEAFRDYVGTVFGLGTTAQHDRDALPDPFKLAHAGLLGALPRHPGGLETLAAACLGLPVRLQDYVGEWMPIEPRERSRLGVSPQTASLGQSAVLGERVWACQFRFRLIIGPMRLAHYRNLLPGGSGLEQLIAVVRNYQGDELAWDVQLQLKREEVPPLRLNGQFQLGWTSWLGHRPAHQGHADDLRLDPLAHAAGANRYH